MTATTVIPFRRDLKKTLATLVAIPPTATEDDLHTRLTQILSLRSEAYRLRDVGVIQTEEISPITDAANCLYTLAMNAGVAENIAFAFERNRADYREYRALLKPCQRL
jgi:hypothetical protein